MLLISLNKKFMNSEKTLTKTYIEKKISDQYFFYLKIINEIKLINKSIYNNNVQYQDNPYSDFNYIMLALHSGHKSFLLSQSFIHSG